MNKHPKISCVIPAYNEGDRIGFVLSVIEEIDLFTDIVLVNNNSEDHTLDVMRHWEKRDSRIKVINNKTNVGKTNSVIRGINMAKGELIVLLDADILSIEKKDIEKLIEPLIKGDYSMAVIERRGSRRAFFGGTGIMRLLGGERAFWKKDFLKINFHDDDQYILGTKLNLYLINKQRKIKSIYREKVDVEVQFVKKGALKAWISYLKMYREVVWYVGFRNIYTQIVNLEDNTTPKLNRLQRKSKVKFLTSPLIFVLRTSRAMFFFLFTNTKEGIIFPIKNKVAPLFVT
ncbi:MAG TPA: glycosyltransferase family 2 protein [bacterium]|nr:glycosyltransferase family 2 protein [bacterium]